uniref:Uncharacterized protein n=1 Tax=Oryza rufipogon TaxID=4529 RepID=A0A0E0PMA4_ORYRU
MMPDSPLESSSSSATDPVALCHTKLDVKDLITTMSWAGHASSTRHREGEEEHRQQRRRGAPPSEKEKRERRE